MGSKIIILKYKNAVVSCLHDGKRAVELDVDCNYRDNIYGNICVGKVRNIVKNIEAAFVEINNGKICYLSLKKAENPIFISHGKSASIKVGDEILVQVSGDNVKSKAPTCSTALELTGKYLVLTRDAGKIAVSSKIEGTAVRKKLKALVEPFVNSENGFIIRTNALNADEERIKAEAQGLVEEYRKLVDNAMHQSCFSVVRAAAPEYVCSVRDGYADQVEEFVTDDEEIYNNLHSYLETYQPEDLSKLRKYEDTGFSLDACYGISFCISDCYKEKIWLKSGGSIVIQTTEALTAIDVNTEKAIKGKSDTQAMFKKINLEAAAEIAYQLRLRNITGIIIVDFIDMEIMDDRRELMSVLAETVKSDPIKTAVIDMTGLNLVEMTRKKQRRPLKEQLFLLSDK